MKHRIITVEETSSTQDLARQWVDENHTGWICYRAKKQTRGRGRLGRSWISPSGGLYFTCILPAQIYPLSWFPLLCGVAVSRALEASGVSTQLKWPNDVLLDRKKVAGILCELYKGFVLAGTGINLHFPIDQLPEEIREKTTSLHFYVSNIHPEEVLHKVLQQMEELLFLPADQLRQLWQEKDVLFGKEVVVIFGKEKIRGIASGVDENGFLIVKRDGKQEVIQAGDVSIRLANEL